MHADRARRHLTVLLMTAAAVLIPLTAHAGQNHHTQADSIWGVVPPTPAPIDPSAVPATPLDSIWG